ncbi:MAG: hypothetical protein J3R72DRAFT_260336 [Linnemannia gamsii]|nr:MAG: hypothetical protein J3R72DRAFT_260336 [Linnemannia gamsii]
MFLRLSALGKTLFRYWGQCGICGWCQCRTRSATAGRSQLAITGKVCFRWMMTWSHPNHPLKIATIAIAGTFLLIMRFPATRSRHCHMIIYTPRTSPAKVTRPIMRMIWRTAATTTTTVIQMPLSKKIIIDATAMKVMTIYLATVDAVAMEVGEGIISQRLDGSDNKDSFLHNSCRRMAKSLKSTCTIVTSLRPSTLPIDFERFSILRSSFVP